MTGQLPKNTGFDPTSIEGQGGITVSGSGNVKVSSGGPGGVGAVVRELYAENQVRPTVVTQPAPGGAFLPILSLAITTAKGNFLDIDAYLGAIVSDLGLGAQYVQSGIRITVDNVPTGLGSALSSDLTDPQPFVNFSLNTRVAVPPGPHTVTLEWSVAGFAGGLPVVDSEIKFTTPDRDGCAMFVREVV